LHPGRTGLLNKMHETLSALLAHRLRKAEEQLLALDIRLERSVPRDDARERANSVPRKRWKNHLTPE
jgi:hypothetical protein